MSDEREWLPDGDTGDIETLVYDGLLVYDRLAEYGLSGSGGVGDAGYREWLDGTYAMLLDIKEAATLVINGLAADGRMIRDFFCLEECEPADDACDGWSRFRITHDGDDYRLCDVILDDPDALRLARVVAAEYDVALPPNENARIFLASHESDHASVADAAEADGGFMRFGYDAVRGMFDVAVDEDAAWMCLHDRVDMGDLPADWYYHIGRVLTWYDV